MKYRVLRRTLFAVCTLVAGVAMLVSCSENGDNLSDKEVAQLQQQLDSTMSLYNNLKDECTEYDARLASKDSAINAQAAEIQRLINKANERGGTSSSKTSSVDSRLLDEQRADIRAKEKQIKILQSRIESQTKQIEQLQAQLGSSQGSDKENAEYQKQIVRLQQQIATQESQIASLREQLSASSNSASNEAAMLKECQGQVSKLDAQVKQYQSDVNGLNKQIAQLNSQLSALQNASSSDTKAAAAQQQQLERQVAELQSQLKACQAQSQQFQLDANAAKNNLSQKSAELQTCQADLAQQVALVKSLQSSQNAGSSNMQQMQAQLAELTQREAACRQRNEDLQQSQASLIAKCEQDKEGLQSTVNSLQHRVNALQANVDILSAKNQLLSDTLAIERSAKSSAGSGNDALVNELRNRLAAQQAEIEQLNSQLSQKDKELADARAAAQAAESPTKSSIDAKLAELQALCDNYAAEIERLRAENAALKAENNELKGQLAAGGDLNSENERLMQKLRLAAVLVTTDVSAIPGKSAQGSVVKSTTKAAQTKVVRVSCQILDNHVVDPGSITIYARIASANNRVLYNGSADEYTFDLDGVTMNYTTKQEIEFTGASRNVVMIWKKADNVEMPAGLYWVTLYANGFEIGKTSFKLD